ncbi:MULTISPECIES: alpha-E domain-containing protein [Halomonadaceae]|uniref:alpha-E domain-containing protein n=1 Tax=Halomonadaceae TaxID=28256 RepID=UPI001598AD32|nr:MULTISPECIES: alpha-E domain-containing protein [Halomonas]QJQ94695.1 alpha-E domain-containing protein [Halomonas sp. PA5]
MLSRVAENLYWMARYIERAEDTARLISVSSHLLLDLPREVSLGWSTLIDITGSAEIYDGLHTTRDERNVLHFLCAERSYGGSILSALGNARENLRTTRDVVPREIWEQINQLYMTISEQAESGLKPRRRDAFLKNVIRGCQTLTGLIEGTMSHDLARTFIEMGRHLERADMTTRILDVRSANLLPKNPDDLLPFENLQWMSVLKSLTAYQMYRQNVRVRVRGPDVLRFLLQDRYLPRSVSRGLQELAWELETLPHHDRALATATLVRAEVAEADIQALANSPDELHRFIDELQIGFSRLHDVIAASYFPHLEESPLPHQIQAHQNENEEDD